MTTLSTLRRRLDAEALNQLRTEAARLLLENERLREQLSVAEADADWWRSEATSLHIDLCEASSGVPGIAQDGALVVAQGRAA